MGVEPVFNLGYGQLGQHANTVDDLARQLSPASSAAGDSIDPQAYGQLCQALPPTLNDTSQRAAQALAGAVQSLTDTASTLRSTGNNFQQADTAGALPLTLQDPP